MFDQIDAKKQKQTYSFIEWMDRFVLTEERLREARDQIYEYEAQVSQLSQMHRTPQSAKHHAEGPLMTNHIETILAGLNAICQGKASLLQIEEFAREKHFALELAELEDVMCENAATLKAFALLHDIAKYDTISFDAPVGSKGAQEGFAADSRLDASQQTDRYLKLLNTFKVNHDDLSSRDTAIAFYEMYQINVHYRGHAKVAVSDVYKEARGLIEDMCRLTARDREVLVLLIEHHIDVLQFVQNKPDGARYRYLMRLAERSGMDSDDVLDLQAAALLLDGVIGSIGYQNRALQPETDIVLNMFRAEQLSDESRRHIRVEKQEAKARKVFKKILQETGLAGEEVFSTLGIPFGPERAGVAKAVEHAVKTGDISGLGHKGKALLGKVQQAHLLYISNIE